MHGLSHRHSNTLFSSAFLLICLSRAALCADAQSQAVRNDAIQVVSQKNISEFACGACSLINMLANGKPELKRIAASLPGASAEERAKNVLKKYGEKPSKTYPNAPRYSEKTGGITCEDIEALVKECLADFKSPATVSGIYLDRTENEEQVAHLRRVHASLLKSLRAGVPPILSIRSLAARKHETEYKWDGLMAHYVTLTEIDPELTLSDKGFRFRYADSYTGAVEAGYASIEEARNFTATRSLTVGTDGKEQWEWKTDYPFLIVTAPSLRLLTQKEPWNTRTIIILSYAVLGDGK